MLAAASLLQTGPTCPRPVLVVYSQIFECIILGGLSANADCQKRPLARTPGQGQARTSQGIDRRPE